MNKKILDQELLINGFNQVKDDIFEKTFNGINLRISTRKNLFNKINGICIYYFFKNELIESLHDIFWNKSIDIIESQNSNLTLGSLGYDFIGVVTTKNILKNFNVEIINQCCDEFSNKMKDLLAEYNL